MKYLLDTDICIYAIKKHPAVRKKLIEYTGNMSMSVITYFELQFGAWNSNCVESNLANAERLREWIPVQPLGPESGSAYGQLRADLHRQGTTIGVFDMVIAAQAMSLGLVLVTNNEREFRRVSGLKIENWATP